MPKPKAQATPDYADCQRACRCGLRFHHDPPCYSDIQGDMVQSCVCPDHPESAPPAKSNVSDEVLNHAHEWADSGVVIGGLRRFRCRVCGSYNYGQDEKKVE